MAIQWRPFVVRRTTGGDTMRADDGWRGALRYGLQTLPLDVVEGVKLIVYPRRYDSMVITVQVPKTIAWTRAVLVRGGFGAPTSPQDGETLWYLEQETPHAVDLSQQVLDTPLTPGNWYYYSLFLYIGGQWVPSYSMDNAVPADHHWSEFLFNTIPMFYQRTDDQQAADGRNGPLRVFARVLGYELDYTNTLADGVRDVYNVDRAPARLLKYLGYNFGVPDEPVLGEARQRSMLQQLSDLNALRGTTLGLKQLIGAATHYACDIGMSGNLLLSVDDGDFNGGDVSQPGMAPLLANDLGWGVGHWTPMLNATVLGKMQDPNNIGTFASLTGTHAVKTAIVAKNTNTDGRLVPPGGTGAMVVNGSGPDTVIACGPLLTNASALYGIPVVPGSLYTFSCQVLRTLWGAAADQPPAGRLVLAMLWFDSSGAFRGASTGPTPPGVTDSGVWQPVSYSAAAPTVAVDSYDAAFAIPAIWWISTTWAGASTTPTVRPTVGRYVSMASFTLVAAAGGGVASIGPDVFLTLGVTTKKLNDPATSKLGIPGRTN
jgi:phage tail-like protein